MHAVIFFGFLTLLVRKLHLIVIGYSPLATIPGAAGGLYTAFKDFIELAVLVAVGYGFWRRFVRRPARLEPNREAVVILTLIALIMLTDFGFDAFRFAKWAGSVPAIAHEQSWAWIGGPLAHALTGLTPAALDWGYQAFYWVQMATVFAFLAILPSRRAFPHRHCAAGSSTSGATCPPNRVPTRRSRAAGADDVDPDTLPDRREDRLDLTWKEGLDAFTCTECGRCKDACPTAPDRQAAVAEVGQRRRQASPASNIATRSAHTMRARLPALVGNAISEETLWACTTCGYCEVACPIQLEHLPKFYRLRQRQVMMEGEFPHELNRVFAAYESQSNPWGLDAATRGDWAKDLGLPIVSSAEEVARLDYLYYVGSASSFDPRGQKIARAFVRVAAAAGMRLGILGPLEGSTGECVRRLGNEMVFQQLAGALVETLNRLGVRTASSPDRSARVQRAEERVAGVRRQLRGYAPHAGDRRLAARGRLQRRSHARADHLSRAVLPRAAQRGIRSSAPRAAGRLARHSARVRTVARQGDVLRRWRRPHVA